MFKKLETSMVVANSDPVIVLPTVKQRLFYDIGQSLVPFLEEASENGGILFVKPNTVEFDKKMKLDGTKFTLSVTVCVDRGEV